MSCAVLISWIVATVLVTLVIVGNATPLKHKLTHEKSHAFCIYGNATYPGGKKFTPDACTLCHCPHHGGRAKCSIEDCAADVSCVRHEMTAEDPCCGTCVEFGCRHTDGVVYAPGALLPSPGPCEHCYCPVGGGRPVCDAKPCPRANCVDAVRGEGDCCRSCPHGENCWLGERVLAAGEVKVVGGCKRCRCPSAEHAPYWLLSRGLHAVCTMQNCDSKG